MKPALAAVIGFMAAAVSSAGAQVTSKELASRDAALVAGAMTASLTGVKGDPARGRAIVVSRQLGLCLLCHSGPFE